MTDQSRYFALVLAAGNGQRFSSTLPKQYQLLGQKTILEYSLHTLNESSLIEHIFLVILDSDTYIHRLSLPEKITLLPVGASTRHLSVLNGLNAMQIRCQPHDWVLVHDAARPGITGELIHQLITQVATPLFPKTQDDWLYGGLLALPVSDTLKREEQGYASETISRTHLWQAQTPQMFRYQTLRQVLQQAYENRQEVTDEASAIEQQGGRPKLIKGSLRNMKITYAEDLEILAQLINLKGNS